MGEHTPPIAAAGYEMLNPPSLGGAAPHDETQPTEAILLRPLPPFRAKPSRKPIAPKLPSAERRDAADISVKARRHPVKLVRLQAAHSLKILSRRTDAHVQARF